MLTLKKIFFLIVSVAQLHLTAQQNKDDASKIIQQYQDYFKTDRKTVHLHLNKTLYLTGETIWFKSYVYNQSKNKRSEESEYVLVDLVDGEGNVIAKKTILNTNGQGNGDLFITNTLTTGLYFLQAYTGSMQGLEEDDSSKYPILITNLSNGDFTNYEYRKKGEEPKVTIASEGGSLISGVFGTCTARIVDPRGKALQPDSVLLMDQNQKRISKIQMNSDGVGSFSLVPKFGKPYHLQVFHEGETFSKQLPVVKKTGVAFGIARNPNQQEILVKITDTRIDKKQNNLSLYIHKDGNIIGTPVGIPDRKGKTQFKINNDLLFNGFNTLSIIDTKGIVHAERLVYHQTDFRNKKFEVTNSIQQTDSVQLALSYNGVSETKEQQVSISILPGATKAERFRKNAFFALHMEAYFPGAQWRNLWNKEFKAVRDLNDMDQLSILANPKYRWKTILNKNLVSPEMHSYTGAIQGVVEVNENVTPKSVILYSKENELLSNTNVIDGKFSFEELVLAKGSKLSLSLIGEDGKPHKANFSYTIQPVITNFRHRFRTKDIHKLEDHGERRSELIGITANTQQLDEVTVTAKRLKYERFFPGYRGIKIDSTADMTTIRDFVRRQGFYPILISPRAKGRRAGTIQLAKRNSRCGLVFPAILLDGVYDQYLSPYEELRMEHIDELYWDRPNACGMIIVVFTNEKYKNRPLPDYQMTSKEIVVTNGFDTPKPFKRPQYFDTNTTSFKHFGILGWKTSTTETHADGLLHLMVPVESEVQIRINIEGYSKSGELISENHLVSLN
ncbi:MAG: hypothetical protein ED555_06160 [Allomuricauda sp.]|nr:MAG: hypothetical protein ED555_06160 [Allomuricauda sp.]